VFVLQYLHITLVDMATVFVILQYLHNISINVATMAVVL